MHRITACRHSKSKRAKKSPTQLPFQVSSLWKKQQSGYRYVTSILQTDFCFKPSILWRYKPAKTLITVSFPSNSQHSSSESDRKSQPKIVPVDKKSLCSLAGPGVSLKKEGPTVKLRKPPLKSSPWSHATFFRMYASISCTLFLASFAFIET